MVLQSIKKRFSGKVRLRDKLLLYILSTVLLIFIATLAFVVVNSRQMAVDDASKYVNANAREYASRVAKELNNDMTVCRSIAKAFQAYPEAPAGIRMDMYNDMLREVLIANPQFVSFWVNWELNAIDPDYEKEHGRVRYTYDRQKGELNYQMEELETDTENPTGIYYDIKANPKEIITEPYFDTYAGRAEEILVTSVAVPIIENGKFAGLVGADVELERFHDLIDLIRPFENSYAIMISDGGNIIAHPNHDLTNTSFSKLDLGSIAEDRISTRIRAGEKISFQYQDEQGGKYFGSLEPFTIGDSGKSWYIGIFVPMSVILEQANQNLWITVLVGIAGIFLLAVVIWWIARNITKHLQQTTRVLKELSEGKVKDATSVRVNTRDEIEDMAEAVNTLAETLKTSARFANEIGKGNYEEKYDPLSDSDVLGNALLRMRENLITLRKENEENQCMQHSIVKVSEQLQGEKSQSALANDLLKMLADIIGFNIAAIFLKTEDKLRLTSSYAYNIRKSNANEFEMGKGLIGQAAFEQKMITFTDIPDDYISIKSGLGESRPRMITVMPLIYQNQVEGVLEMGTVREISQTQLALLKRISENIAIAFRSIQLRNEMESLLHKTREQAEELKSQQQELVKANKELEEQTNALKASEEELRQQQEELRVTNEELEEKTKSLEEQKTEVSDKNLQLENAREDLERKAEELAVASKYKSEFLANMSHELRTPLNSLLILSQNLANNKGGNLDEEQVESANIIHKSGSDLLNMINDILDLSKIESGKMSLNVDEVKPEEVSENIKNYFAHVTKQKNIDLKIKINKQVPKVIQTDQQKLEQIIKNFMSNAVKFTKEGGITIRFYLPGTDADLSRSGLDNGKAIAISVTDTGIGIPREKQLEIFEAFQQADGSTSRLYGGTGLGLSISRELAKLMGGEIQLESEVNKGSTFTLYIPLKATSKEVNNEKTASRSAQASAASIPEHKPKIQKPEKTDHLKQIEEAFIQDDRGKLKENDAVILVVEDDPNFAGILLKQCHQNDFKCLATPTGEAGYELARKYKPQAIILDIKLPGITGWHVLDLLKEDPQTRHIPVHIMSGEQESLDAFKKGAIGYLTKPIKKKELDRAFGRLEDLINRKMSSLLLVEDNPELRKSVKILIGENDVEISEAASGKAALKLLKDNIYDCMVLDLGLPDMSGFELIQKMEKLDVGQPPIIVYTGKDLSKEENEELHKYAETVIIKGVKSEERLLDETALFLHRMVDKMPEKQQAIIKNLHNTEEAFNGKKVLLADDDMRNVFALTKILKESGMEVLRADNGESALEMLEKNKDTDLVLMDIMMPVMDGYEAIKKIRKQSNFRNLPIIALTAKAMKEDRQKCLDAGASDYISKPINIDQLLSLMRVWLYK